MQQSARTYATLKSDMAEFIDLSRIVLYPEVCGGRFSSIYGGSAECEKAADGLFAKLGDIRATRIYSEQPQSREKQCWPIRV